MKHVSFAQLSSSIRQLLTHIRWSDERVIASLFLGLSLATFLGFGLHHLGKFETTDEALWVNNPQYGRVHAYWNAWRTQKWEKTFVNDKPGVTTSLVGGFGYLVDKHPDKKLLENKDSARVFNPPYMEHTLFYFRLPFLFLNAALILALYFLIRRYTESTLVGLFSAMFMYLSPTLIGISQIINPDTTLWSLVVVSLFSYLNYLKTLEKKYLLFATLAAGFALLSKYSAVLLLIFLYALTYAYLFFHHDSLDDRETFFNAARKMLGGYLVLCLGSILLFAFALPGIIAHPDLLTDGTVGFIKYSRTFLPFFFLMTLFFGATLIDALWWRSRFLFTLFDRLKTLRTPIIVLSTTVLGALFVVTLIAWSQGNTFGLTDIPFDDAKSKLFRELGIFNKLLLETRPLLFTLTPLVLVGALGALFRIPLSKTVDRYRFLTFVITAFTFSFYLAVLFQGILVHVRYSIMLYPLMSVLAGIGLAVLVERFRTPIVIASAGTILLLLGILSILSSRPFYFNYINSLLAPPTSITSPWGYGGYEAAQYLNSLPDAKNLVVWVDYGGVCPFFVGKCIKGLPIKRWYEKHPDDGVDYVVVTKRGLKETRPYFNHIRKTQLIHDEPVWQVLTNGREESFVRIHRVEQREPGRAK